MNYQHLYLEYFDTYTKNFKKKFYEKLKNYKSKGRSYDYARKEIKKSYHSDYGNLSIESAPYDLLIGIFDGRLEYYVAENQLNIISEELYQKFNELDRSNSYSYSDFVKELAFINSRSLIINIINGDLKKSKSHFEKDDVDGIEINISPFVNFSEPKVKIKKEPTQKFTIPKKYVPLFKRKDSEFYSELTDEFIDSELTSLDDFVNVFKEPFKKHNSKIHFFCSSQKAAFLLSQLNFISKSINHKNIALSELFQTKFGNPFKESNISKSKNTISSEDKKSISDLLNKFIISK